MVCKLSIVIPGSEHAGAIIDTPAVPNVGDHLTLESVAYDKHYGCRTRLRAVFDWPKLDAAEDISKMGVDYSLVRELNAAVSGCENDDSVRCLIITGSGDKIFCAGDDLGSAFAGESVDAFIRFGKGRHPAGLNFGDCISYALAQSMGLPLLYKGDDFAKTDIVSAVQGQGPDC